MSRRLASVWLLRTGAVIVIAATWLYAIGPGGTSRLILPAPGDVLTALLQELSTGELYANALFTLSEILAAYGLAVVTGVVAGLVLARGDMRSRIWEPLLIWGYIAPSVLFFPLFILWFGVGPWSKILFGAASAVFPIAYNTLRGLKNVDPTLQRLGRAFNASPFQADFLIKFPAALPLIAVGLRIGAASALITVVLGEMLAATNGLAYELSKAGQMYSTARVYALIICLVIVVAMLQLLIKTGLKPRWESRSK